MRLRTLFQAQDDEYKNYGQRGISVCDEWLQDYDNFAEWAFQSGYDVNAKRGECTLDRIDVNADYCPINCRWISNVEQQNNRRKHVYIIYDGETYTLAQLARKLDIPYKYMQSRYSERNMPIQKIIDSYAASK